MSVIVLLLAVGILLAGGFLAGFIWAVRTGQFDDTFTPALRILGDGEYQRHDTEGPAVKTRERDSHHGSR